MIYFALLFSFFKIGCFAFGGAYGAIPLIRDEVLSHNWLTDEMLSYIIAVSESSPGPIMVNLATYIGTIQGGILGAVIATFAVVLPSFIIILLITILLKTALQNQYVQAVIRGLKPCIIGIVLATGIYMTLNNCFGIISAITISLQSIIITIALVVSMFGYKKLKNRKLSPIMLIIIAAFLGIGIYSI